MKCKRINKLLSASIISLLFCGLSACQWENMYSDKAFLSFKYKLEACADIQGQDPSSRIWFSEYKGVPYSDLFDLSFEKSYLDFKVTIINGRAVGLGHLFISWKTGGIFEDRSFEYYCTAVNNNISGKVFASNVPECYEEWVYSIYWCRLNMRSIIPDSQENVVLTFHFRNGEPNPVPPEFSNNGS